MKTVGLIVEYNPLHNGHVYHFHQSKAVTGAEAAVCVMSGNFLQRGEPAIVNKWARAEMALNMGADLVIELPVAFSSQPAEWFAYGAVSALEQTGVVDCLCFGSESGNIDWLEALADLLHDEPESFRRELKNQLKKGLNYPAAYSQAVAGWCAANAKSLASRISPEQLAQPNNTLGLHYLIALRRLKSPIKAYTIAREKAGYNQQTITDRQIASATAIRRLLLEEGQLSRIAPYVPHYTQDILERESEAGRAPVHWDRFGGLLLYRLLHLAPAQLGNIFEMSEGLENRIKQALPEINPAESPSVEQLIERLKTKRYTKTKLQRALLRVLLGHEKTELPAPTLRQGVPYLRILGFSEKGRKLLKTMKKTAKVPVVDKVTKCSSPLLDMDIRAAQVYALGYPRPQAEEIFRDYYQAPVSFLGGSDSR